MESQDERLLALARSGEVQTFLAMPKTAVYIARRDGHLLWLSPQIRDLFGYDPASLVGQNAWNVFATPEGLKDAATASAHLNDGDIAVWLYLKRADGSADWFRVDALNREGGVVLAFKVETLPQERRFHWFARMRR